jgi:hypothetical protein
MDSEDLLVHKDGIMKDNCKMNRRKAMECLNTLKVIINTKENGLAIFLTVWENRLGLIKMIAPKRQYMKENM